MGYTDGLNLVGQWYDEKLTNRLTNQRLSARGTQAGSTNAPGQL